MIRLIAVAGFALAVATSTQAMTPAPIYPPYSMITQVAWGCGLGRTRGQWCLHGQSYHPPNPQVCVMDRTRLRSVPLLLKNASAEVGLDQVSFDVSICLSAGEATYWM